MKAKVTVFVVFFLTLFSNSVFSQNSRKLEITVSYERQAGRGSNQYAVWIEDSSGKLVKTLYVTRFTAEGGYVSRPGCTPLWVEKADAKKLSKKQVDAISGATPKTGKHTYTWDLTDNEGRKVVPGIYTFIVQGTYTSPDSQVLFKGNVNISSEKELEIKTTPEYSTDKVQNKEMIKEVTAKFH